MEVIESLVEKADGFLQRVGRPFVTLSYAQSLDGCISARAGEPLAISGSESLILTHQLRAHHEVILVGIGTILSDDPRLTVRLVEGKNPRPVILDSRLRVPATARVFSQNGRSPMVVTRNGNSQERCRALVEVGATVLTVDPNSRGQVSLHSLLDRLGQMGVKSVMVEGGSRVITSFLLARLADYAVLTVSPVFVGGLRAVSDLNQSDPKCFLRIKNPGHQWLGDDLILWGDLA
ncbi:MAG: RibD family protein [Desulfomonile sp.]|nr:RibD family protein [Desulfomonile sp.]